MPGAVELPRVGIPETLFWSPVPPVAHSSLVLAVRCGRWPCLSPQHSSKVLLHALVSGNAASAQVGPLGPEARGTPHACIPFSHSPAGALLRSALPHNTGAPQGDAVLLQSSAHAAAGGGGAPWRAYGPSCGPEARQGCPVKEKTLPASGTLGALGPRINVAGIEEAGKRRGGHGMSVVST